MSLSIRPKVSEYVEPKCKATCWTERTAYVGRRQLHSLGVQVAYCLRCTRFAEVVNSFGGERKFVEEVLRRANAYHERVGLSLNLAGSYETVEELLRDATGRGRLLFFTTTRVVTANPDESVAQALGTFVDWDVRHLPVVDDDGRLQGVLTTRDVIGLMGGDPRFEDVAAEHGVDELMAKPVEQFATKKLVTTSRNYGACDAVRKMVENDVGAIPVVESDKLLSIFTERDVMHLFHVLVLLSGKRLQFSPRADVVTISPDTTIGDAARTFTEKHFRRLPVVDDSGRVVGMVTTTDIVNAAYSLGRSFAEVLNEPVRKVMIMRVRHLPAGSPLDQAVRVMSENNFGSMLYVDEAGRPAGIVTERDVLRLAGSACESIAASK
ncbi:MAG: hypothetical protein Kow0069_16100 [Promethearchaeota archaeon]